MKHPKGHKEVTEEVMRGRLRGFSCENCGHVFREGEIVFHPNDMSDPEPVRGKWFCAYSCSLNFLSVEDENTEQNVFRD